MIWKVVSWGFCYNVDELRFGYVLIYSLAKFGWELVDDLVCNLVGIWWMFSKGL